MSRGSILADLQPFSVENSYIFTSPLQAKADSRDKIRITIFILDNQGLGVKGKKVKLSYLPGLIIDPIQEITDEYGKAVFDVSSTTPGNFDLEVYVEGKKLKQRAMLKFNSFSN